MNATRGYSTPILCLTIEWWTLRHPLENKATLNNLSANSCHLSAMYTNTDNLTNKRNELLTIISAANLDLISITETFLKHTHLPINKCEVQVHDYVCFSNKIDSNCYGGIVIYVKCFLNATRAYSRPILCLTIEY